jgi:hypothetical protein
MATHAAERTIEDATIKSRELAFEAFFGISLLVNFFVEFKVEDEPMPVRNL